MNEHPIIMSSDMVRAILDGRKTQTRRIIKPQPQGKHISFIDLYNQDQALGCWTAWTKDLRMCNGQKGNIKGTCHWKCPCGVVGDRLWVRETWKMCNKYPDQRIEGNVLYYKADMPTDEDWGKWKSPRFMFKKYARIWLEITGIRVERVQEISGEDAKVEGIDWGEKKRFPAKRGTTWLGDYWDIKNECIKRFHTLWDSIHGKDAWEKNEWIWVIEFKRVQEMPE